MQTPQYKQIKNNSTLIKNSLVIGLGGCFGVFCQTVGLLWHFNVHQQQARIHQIFFIGAAKILYQKGGIVKFYKGFFPAFRSASLARFGDTFFNSLIIKKLNSKKKLKSMSVPLKSATVWIFASSWRLAIIPFLAFQGSLNDVFHFNKTTRNKLVKSMRNLYIKRAKPEIISLYFWFTFHNYADIISHPLKYHDNLPLFIIRNALVGFGSMICYDAFLMTFRKIKNISGFHNRHNVLLGECHSPIFMKGMHGLMFCTFSNLFKLGVEKYNKAH